MISNSKTQELFVSPVLTFDVDVDVEKTCYEMETILNWHDELVAGRLDGTEIKRVYDEVHQEIIKYGVKYGLPDQVNLATATRIWHDFGDRETAHFHLGGFFSSIIYLKTPPGGGDLLVLDPRGPACWNMFNAEDYNHKNYGKSDCRSYQRIVPHPGRVVVLPSWLVHYSEQNLSQDPRVLMVSDWNLFDWGTVDKSSDYDNDITM